MEIKLLIFLNLLFWIRYLLIVLDITTKMVEFS
jgi:hypothetical protein